MTTATIAKDLTDPDLSQLQNAIDTVGRSGITGNDRKQFQHMIERINTRADQIIQAASRGFAALQRLRSIPASGNIG